MKKITERKIVNNYGSFDLTFVKGKGSTMWDSEGKKYIDFIAGIGVNCLGHNYKPLVKAIADQAKRQIHISNYYFSDIGLIYADELMAITGFEKGYFERIRNGEQSQQFLAVGSFAVCSFLRSLLAAENIPTYTENEHINSMYSFNTLGGNSSFAIKVYILIIKINN